MIGRAIIHTHGGWGEVLVRSDLIYSVLVVSRRRRRPPFPWGGMEVHGSVEEEEKSSSSSSTWAWAWAWDWCKSKAAKAEAKGVGGGSSLWWGSVLAGLPSQFQQLRPGPPSP